MATFFLFCLLCPLAFSAWLVWKVYFSGPKQLKENNPALLLNINSPSEVRVWFFTWLSRRRVGEVLTDSTNLTEYEVQLGFYDAKARYMVEPMCCECFSMQDIKTASDFVERLERHLERHHR
jgi:hypothetical protein